MRPSAVAVVLGSLGALVVLALCFISWFGSGVSASYESGFNSGQSGYMSEAGLTALSFCQQNAAGAMPEGANRQQWVQGCVAGAHSDVQGQTAGYTQVSGPTLHPASGPTLHPASGPTLHPVTSPGP